MLIDMENGGAWITSTWIPELYDEMVGRLSPEDFANIRKYVNSRFDTMLTERDGQVTTGAGTDEERLGPLYQTAYQALDRSEERVAQFEALLYCAIAIERPESWGCYHDEEDESPLPDQTYYPMR